MSDYPQVRELLRCPICNHAKDAGLIVCWPCHRHEKRMAMGGYSESTLATLDELEARLGKSGN